MHILTFDIEEWFHILDNSSTRTEKEWCDYEYRIDRNLDRILSLLDDKQQRATFFCLGWIAKQHPDVIKKIDNLGYEIASHSDMHQLIYEQSQREFSDDLANSIKRLEDITGKKIRAFRAPGFSLKEQNIWAFDAMIEHGIEIDCSIFPSSRAHGGYHTFIENRPCTINISGSTIREFPINVFHFLNARLIFSGGGYFRLLPYSILSQMFRTSDYVMTYFHPRDFDPDQPLIRDLSLVRKFKSYYGLHSAFHKLEKILEEFKFVDLDTANKSIDWRLAGSVTL